MFRILDASSGCILGCTLAFGMLGAEAGAKAATFELLYGFKGGTSDGGNPVGGVIADKAGSLYGTTSQFGTYNGGIAFKLAPDGTETVLHDFGGGDGASPADGLIADRTGNLYGTTNFTVFKLTPGGTESTLYTFRGGNDGAYAYAGLLLRKNHLYGTTTYGGGMGCHQQMGCGTVFEVALNGNETVLHHFKLRNDGVWPYAGLVADGAGNLYGTTSGGGGGCARPYLCGTVFRVAPDGTETVLYAFGGFHGAYPLAGLTMDSAGNLYGTTVIGGANTGGTVFKLAPNGTETVFYSFCSQTNCNDGGMPYAGVIADKAGNLYGTTTLGGPGKACGGVGCGTVFKLAQDGTETVLYTFTGGSDGANPYAGLLLRQGYLYGTTFAAGGGNCSGSCGTVFRVKL